MEEEKEKREEEAVQWRLKSILVLTWFFGCFQRGKGAMTKVQRMTVINCGGGGGGGGGGGDLRGRGGGGGGGGTYFLGEERI